jgi:hypothetical protein
MAILESTNGTSSLVFFFFRCLRTHCKIGDTGMRTVNSALKVWILKHPFGLDKYIDTNISEELVPPSSD